MSIQYVRTMKIKYGDKMDDTEFAKLSAELAKKGLFLTGEWSNHNDYEYGFVDVEENSHTFGIVINYETQFTVDYISDAQIICEGLENLHPDVYYTTIATTVNKKEWAEPAGNFFAITLDIEGSTPNLDTWGQNIIEYEDNVQMKVILHNNYDGLKLEFRIIWDCENVQRKEAIEEAMVHRVLNDMGKIQKVVESRLKLKKFGYDVEDVSIDCHFDAKTESRSECTPDIIKQVRDARRK